MTKRICVWAVPRTTSTALMYSFRSRKHDTFVVDEPLYGHYLSISNAQHPLNHETVQQLNSDGQAVMHDLTYGMYQQPILFIKHMCHHALELEWNFLADLTNVFLIRDPVETIPSLAKIIGTPILRDTGFDKQIEIFEKVCHLKQKPLVIDRTELLKNPRVILTKLCERLDIPFDESMFAWESGRKLEDNIGNENWYNNVRQSTGFKAYKPPSEPFPKKFIPLLNVCRPYYEKLAKHAIRVK